MRHLLLIAVVWLGLVLACTDGKSVDPVRREQQLAIASEIRNSLRSDDVPASVVTTDNRLRVTYLVASIEYMPEQFVKKQGESGMKRIAREFDTLIVEAKNYSTGRLEQKEVSLADYR